MNKPYLPGDSFVLKSVRCLVQASVALAMLLASCVTPLTSFETGPQPTQTPVETEQVLPELVMSKQNIVMSEGEPPEVIEPAPEMPAYPLLDQLAGQAEVVDRRTASSATFDMGDGSYTLVQDSRPMHYQDKQGNWQRINPAFARVENGWVNYTNLLHTGLSPRSSDASLSVGTTGVKWEPTCLAATGGLKGLITLATRLESEAASASRSVDGRSVSYTGSWSEPALQDEWQTGYGSAEYRLHLASLPDSALDLADLDNLELRVNLHLLPGTTIQVAGKAVEPARLPLETRGEISFVSAEGEALWLQSPRAYEEGDPSVDTAGSYALAATNDPTTLELRVRLPWKWLAAEERHFPVVIDPLFWVTYPILARRAEYNMDRSFAGISYFNPLGLGPYSDSVLRILVRFNLQGLLPPGSTIDQAYLEAVPSNINITNRSYLSANAQAFPLTDSAWTSSSTAEPHYNEAAPLGTRLISYSRGQAKQPTVQWDVTSLAQQWATPFSTQNYGILLKLADEFCFMDVDLPFGETTRIWPEGCGAFEFAHPSNYGSLGLEGGLQLVVRYTGDDLYEGETKTDPTTLGKGIPNPKGDQEPYYHLDHEYLLPALPDYWQAVAVRGIGQTSGIAPTDVLSPAFIRYLQGPVNMELRSPSDVEIDTGESNYRDLAYILLDGRNVSGSPANRLRVKAVEGDNLPLGYEVQLVGEKGNIAVPLGVPQILEYTFDTQDTLAVWNIQLPQGSNSRVDVEIYSTNATGIHPSSPAYYAYDYVKGFGAQLFESYGSPNYWYKGYERRDIELANTWQDKTGHLSGERLTSGTFTPGSDPYALVLAYNGPQVTFSYAPKPPTSRQAEFASMQELRNLTFNYRVRILACGTGKFPTKQGTCQEIKCPLSSFPAGNKREAGGWQLWSEEGWDSGSPPATSTANTIAPMIGPTGGGAPTVAVVGGQISYDTAGNVSLDNNSSLYLVHCPASPVTKDDYFQVYEGAMQRQLIGGQPRLVPSASGGARIFDPWPLEDRDVQDVTDELFYINPIDGTANGGARLWRRTGVDLLFTTSYSVDVGGWLSLQAQIAQIGADDPPKVANTLVLELGSDFSMDLEGGDNKFKTRKFKAVRATSATITQPPELGSASKAVQALILPVGELIPSSPPQDCTGSCVDVRAPDDSPGLPKRVWQMPDIHTGGTAGMVVLSTQGKLHVMSVDHPAATSAPTASQDFSFDTFGGSVSIERAQCGGSGPEVTVIRGQTRLAIPMVGSGSDSNSVVNATFTLCSSKLRNVSFEFHSPVGIPIGSTGLFATGLEGKVDINPGYTEIKIKLDFQAAQGGDGGIFKGSGEVTIRTDGYFEFAGAGRLLGRVDANGKLWVAWSPLDVGLEMSMTYPSTSGDWWLTGLARMHMWVGQGWQGKYPWLPDNDEKHLSALFSVTLHVEEGAAFSWAFIDIPPDDINIGIEIAFGQFCTNANCTAYEWGIKGKFKVAGFSVGLYYGFSHGVNFILGNDGHVLIDQYGGAKRRQLEKQEDLVPWSEAREAVSETRAITVTADTEELLIALGWQGSSSPQLAVYDHNNVDITTSPNYTVAISETANAAASTYNKLIGVQLKQPIPTLEEYWRADISGLPAGEPYEFIYLASKGAPGWSGNRGRFIKPGTGIEDGSGVYTITWEVPANTPVSSTISLYYAPYVRDELDRFWPDYMGWDRPIVKNLPFSQGWYRWDTSGLEGTRGWPGAPYYKIRAAVDDGVNDFPPGSVSDPCDPCQPRNLLPPERAFEPNSFPGLSVFTATGWIAITDTIAPPAPTGLTLKGIDDAILARWDPLPDTEKDLAAYLVQWGERSLIPLPDGSWVGGSPSHAQRVTPVTTPTLRIGGLKNDLSMLNNYGVIVSAIDASDNIGPSSPIAVARPTSDTMTQVPPHPVDLDIEELTSDSAIFWWNQPSGTPASYRLTYRWLTPTTWYAADVVGYVDTTEPRAVVENLRTGATYRVSVSAANSEGWRSADSPPIIVTVTDGVDSDGDGMPDDWETAYSLSDPLLDVDGDGLSNLGEYQAGTSPKLQDSDNDGFSDWEESQDSTDPLDSSCFPACLTQPRLALSPTYLKFYARPGEPEPAAKYVRYENVGGGNMVLMASASQPWIKTAFTWLIGHRKVSVDASGLAPGFYSGTVRFEQAPGQGDPLIEGGQCVGVGLWVLPADVPPVDPLPAILATDALLLNPTYYFSNLPLIAKSW